MTLPVGSQLDLMRIPVVGIVPEAAGTAPATPVEGQLWVDTSTNPDRLKVYEGATNGWVLVSQTGSELLTNKGAANGYAPLNASSQVPLANLSVAASGVNSSTALVRADDSRLSDQRVPTDASVTGGTAGAGVKIAANTITAANIANATITDTQVAAANKDGAAGTASMRTLGTGAQQAMAGNTRLDTIAAPTGSVSLNSQKITNLAEPTAATDAATKQYVDARAAGLDPKASVRAASTANVAGTYSATGGTSGRGQFTAMPNTIDGVTLAAGNRVLLKNQSTGAQNGIWVITTLGSGANGVWDRATDFDEDAEVTSGAFTFVEEGTTNDNTGWVLTTNNPIVIGGGSGTSLAFTQFSGGAALTAGNGLVQNGSAFDVVGTSNRITVAADAIDIAATYVGQTSITTLGTITSGTWTGTSIAVANGGTGATTAAAARTNLGANGKYAQDLGALTAGVEQTVTHSLGSTDVQAMFRTTADGAQIILNWRVISTTQIGVTADVAFSAAAIRVVVQG